MPTKGLKRIGKAARLLGLFRIISMMPIPLAYRLAGMIGNLDHFFHTAYLQATRNGLVYLRTGKFRLSDREIEDFTRRHARMMAREVVDSWMVSGRNMNVLGRISSLSGAGLVRQKLDQGKGLLILVCHYSRLNMVACTLGREGISTSIITQCVDRRNRYLDWVDRYYLSGKLERYQQVTKGTLVTLEDNLRPVYKALFNNEPVILLMDAFHPKFIRFNEYPFLGGKIRLPAGALRLAEKTGAPMVYGVARENGWKIEVDVKSLPGSFEEAHREAALKLEQDVLARPWEWWQWCNIRDVWKAEN